MSDFCCLPLEQWCLAPRVFSIAELGKKNVGESFCYLHAFILVLDLVPDLSQVLLCHGFVASLLVAPGMQHTATKPLAHS